MKSLMDSYTSIGFQNLREWNVPNFLEFTPSLRLVKHGSRAHTEFHHKLFNITMRGVMGNSFNVCRLTLIFNTSVPTCYFK